MLSKILSIMMLTALYSAVFAPSVFCTFQAEKAFGKKKYAALILWSIPAILIPCVFSAFRGIEVGVDIKVYAELSYRTAARMPSYGALLHAGTRFEAGYLLIAYIASHVFHTFHAMLFLTQLLVDLPVFIASLRLRKYAPSWCIMLCFYLLFYIETFNIMRQGIAVSFVFLAFTELIKWNRKNMIWAGVWTLLGIQFHSSAIIGTALMVFVILISRIESDKTRYFLMAVMAISVPVLLKSWTSILTAVSSTGLIKASYANYVDMFSDSAFFTDIYFVNYLELLARWCGFAVPLLFMEKREKTPLRTLMKYLKYPGFTENVDMQFCLVLASFVGTLGYSAVFLLMHSSYGYRITMYLEILMTLFIPSVLKRKRKVSLSSMPVGVIIVFGGVFMCFLLLYMWRGLHGTKPFYMQIYHF